MMGIRGGYRTKKELKESGIGREFTPIETSMFNDEYKGDGDYPVVGPSPTERNWFALVSVVDGKIAKVK